LGRAGIPQKVWKILQRISGQVMGVILACAGLWRSASAILLDARRVCCVEKRAGKSRPAAAHGAARGAGSQRILLRSKKSDEASRVGGGRSHARLPWPRIRADADGRTDCAASFGAQLGEVLFAAGRWQETRWRAEPARWRDLCPSPREAGSNLRREGGIVSGHEVR